MFVARQSNHIQEDIARNWSSWNFGQEGFSGSMNELIIGLKKQKILKVHFGFQVLTFGLKVLTLIITKELCM